MLNAKVVQQMVLSPFLGFVNSILFFFFAFNISDIYSIGTGQIFMWGTDDQFVYCSFSNVNWLLSSTPSPFSYC